MTEARPVQQITNPIKPPEFVQWAIKVRPSVKEQLIDFSERHGYSNQDVIDAALQDYMEMHEKAHG